MNLKLEPLCPACKHPVVQHDEFFCMHIKCFCNHGRIAAQALYERDLYKAQVDELVETMKKMYHVALELQKNINQDS